MMMMMMMMMMMVIREDDDDDDGMRTIGSHRALGRARYSMRTREKSIVSVIAVKSR